MKKPRRHLSYANVAATLALLFAMSGGAIAANHYLINSTKQINPKVIKKLKGNRGPKGFTGTSGLAGTQGPTGPPGAKGGPGPKGTEGAKGTDGFSALSTLPSGTTESGEYGDGSPGGTAGETLEIAASFPIPLAQGTPESHVELAGVATPTTNCSGPGHAAKGFLCIYKNVATGVNPATEIVFNPEIAPSPGGSGRFGFMLAWSITAGDPRAFGTFSVTGA